jgi:hypothetical protein
MVASMIKSILRTVVVLAIVIPMAGCDSVSNTAEDPDVLITATKGGPAADLGDLSGTQACQGLCPLTDAEKAGLLFVYEEELLAQDVYAAMFELWGTPMFATISASETVHAASVALLIDHYGLENPAAIHVAGVFENADLQDWYDALMASGSVSLLSAFEAGVEIEEVDIANLTAQLAFVDNKNIIQVYQHLLTGSQRHLDAFLAHIEAITN